MVFPNSAGQTLAEHNQTARFGPHNVSALLDYVCVENRLGFAQHAAYNYLPVCEFPWINKGWRDNGEPGFEDVVFDDCSITMGQALNNYDSQCVTFIILSLIPVGLNIWFLKYTNECKMKKQQNKYWFMLKKPNINEKLLLLNVLLGLFHAFRCIDFLGYAMRLSLTTTHTISTGFCVAVPIHLGFLLVTR